MTATVTPPIPLDATEPVPMTEVIDRALDRLDVEMDRAAKLLAHGPKCRRLSALHEREARLWRLLVQHTATRAYWRAAIAAELAARDRARNYADLARYWQQHGEPSTPPTTAGGSS